MHVRIVKCMDITDASTTSENFFCTFFLTLSIYLNFQNYPSLNKQLRELKVSNGTSFF
jgi:hypothetical protein